ncbi:MAG: hypothetical protein RML12_02920 [Xanthomonadales bacterium]|nr:hypothetical protein [Xanthomonadales bacterium]
MSTLVAFAALLWTAASLSPSGNILIQGDPEEWVIASHEENERVATTVLLRPGASLASWREMLTFMEIRGSELPRAVAGGLRDRLLAHCPDSRFEFLRDRAEDVLYEFRSGGCGIEYGHARQHEIGRVARTAGGALRVAYAVNAPEMAPELRRRFVTLIDGRLGDPRTAPVRSLPALAGRGGPEPDLGAETPAGGPAAVVREASRELERLHAEQEALLAELDRLGAEAREDAARDAGRRARPEAPGELATVRLHELRGDGSPGAVTSEFKSTDGGMWALMPLSARSGADVRVRWIYEGGEAGGERLLREFPVVWEHGFDTVRSLLQFTGFAPVGAYRVEVLVDGRLVGVGRFRVRRAGQFG